MTLRPDFDNPYLLHLIVWHSLPQSPSTSESPLSDPCTAKHSLDSGCVNTLLHETLSAWNVLPPLTPWLASFFPFFKSLLNATPSVSLFLISFLPPSHYSLFRPMLVVFPVLRPSCSYFICLFPWAFHGFGPGQGCGESSPCCTFST